MRSMTTGELARELGAELVGSGEQRITGLAPVDRAKTGHLTFADNDRYFARAEQSAATAVLVDQHRSSRHKTLLRVEVPRVAFAKVLSLFFPEPRHAPGIHSTAVIAASARIDPTAHVGPLCVVGERATIGARTALLGGNHVGADCLVGEDGVLFPNVVLYAGARVGHRVRIHAGAVIGSDGYGYVFDQDHHRKVQQVGNVEIHDDVEIGANSCVDRATLGSTVIGRGTKIDNLVQVGHNVSVGEHCLLVGQCGIAGSTRLGDHVTVAGQAAISGHLTIGDRVTVCGQSGVIDDIPEGESWLGAPAGPAREVRRQYIAVRRLPEMLRRLADLEKQCAALTSISPTPED